MSSLNNAADDRLLMRTATSVAKNLSCPGFELELSTLARIGNSSLVERFLSESIPIEAGSNVAQNRELYTISFWGLTDSITPLIRDAGADVNAKNPHSLWTPLHAACFQERRCAADILLRSGANPLSCDSEGRTPADFAAASDIMWPIFERITTAPRPTRMELVNRKVLSQAYVNGDGDLQKERDDITLPVKTQRRRVPQPVSEPPFATTSISQQQQQQQTCVGKAAIPSRRSTSQVSADSPWGKLDQTYDADAVGRSVRESNSHAAMSSSHINQSERKISEQGSNIFDEDGKNTSNPMEPSSASVASFKGKTTIPRQYHNVHHTIW